MLLAFENSYFCSSDSNDDSKMLDLTKRKTSDLHSLCFFVENTNLCNLSSRDALRLTIMCCVANYGVLILCLRTWISHRCPGIAMEGVSQSRSGGDSTPGVDKARVWGGGD